MIQRIQSLYLLVVFILISLTSFMPLALLVGANGKVFPFFSRGILGHEPGAEMIYNSWPLAVLLVLIALIALVSLFLYKKRILQIRFTVINILLMIGSLGLIYYNVNSQVEALNATVQYQIADIFPVIGAILSYLAIRSIGKDEALIRSIDRIR